MTLPDLNLSII
ncbi:uncharacterized protein FFE2_16069 [Fusarium fujikuroi]|nr:uncharacterized protein FFE2_16069 [Fusarium fujikuroi]